MQQNNFIDYIKIQFKTGGVIKKIILVNAFVFIVLILFKVVLTLFNGSNIYDFIGNQLIMPGTISKLLFKPWTLITSLFTHFELGHFFWNMLMFFFTAKMFVQFFGERRLLTTYLLGGAFGGLIHILAYLIFPFFQHQQAPAVMGASGSIATLIGALVYYKPHLKIRLFFAIEIPFWAFGIFFILGDLINLTSADTVAHFAHLGGVLFGVLSVINVNTSNNFMNKFDKLFDNKITFKKKSKLKVYRNSDANKMTDDQYKSNKVNKQKRIDAILDKISANGYESLSKKEKEFLFKFGNE